MSTSPTTTSTPRSRFLLTSDAEAEAAVDRLAVEGDANPIKTKLGDEHGVTSFKRMGLESGVTTMAAVDDGDREDGCNGAAPTVGPRSGAHQLASTFVVCLCVFALLLGS